MTALDDEIIKMMQDGREWTVPELMHRLFPDVESWQMSSRRTHIHNRLSKLVKWGIVERTGYRTGTGTGGKITLWRLVE